jgi:leucyl aminopeptidase (aminopeptidase T)
MINEQQEIAIKNIIYECGGMTADDKVLILCDESTYSIASQFLRYAKINNNSATLIEIPNLLNHGAEPIYFAEEAMCRSTLIMSLCKFSLAHSMARVKSAKAGARFLSLPLYDWNLLDDECLRINFPLQADRVKKFANAFTDGNEIRVTTEAGTDIWMSIAGRVGNYCPGFVRSAGDLGSPPDIEANISPIESSAKGLVVVDGSITMPGFGLLDEPVEMEVSSGKVVAFRSKNLKYVEKLNRIFGDIGSLRRVIAECGVGLNPAAKLTGSMLTDEGALGCMHFGLGSNYTVGGLNNVDFHLDFVFRNATLFVDSKKIINHGLPLI